MRKLYNNTAEIPLKTYLRADPHTQIYQLNGNELVTKDMFWGTSSEDSLYLDYKEIEGRKIRISDGISNNNSHIKEDTECDYWLRDNLYNTESNMLYVIQGYAGCGKTTLMQHVVESQKTKSFLCYIDVGEKWSYEHEPIVFFEETLSKFLNQVHDVLSRNNWNLIWEQFILMGRDGAADTLDTSIRSIMSPLKNIIKCSNLEEYHIESKELIDEIVSDIGSYLTEKFSITQGTHQNQGQIGAIVSLLILLNCAKSIIINDNPTHIIIYDNLDVITNPAIPAEMVLSLWITMSKYKNYIKQFPESDKLPNFSIYIAVRKVLFSHITAYLPGLEQVLQFDYTCAIVCDISELYLSQKLLEHRIEYWLKKSNIDSDTKTKLERLNKITPIMGTIEEFEMDDKEYYLPKPVIDLDGLFNHNFRACANMLSELLENESYSNSLVNIFENKNSSSWQKTSTLIFMISLIYRKLRIWNKFGFGCRNFDSKIYPTTLFRLILTYLYVSRVGHALNNIHTSRKDIPTNDFVPLNKILDLFNDVPFIRIKTDDSQEQIESSYNNIKKHDIQEHIISLLAEMCTTGGSITDPFSRGYSDEDELWRRPIYFVGGVRLEHTAASLDELKQYFQQNINSNSGNEMIEFSITDEGCVIISDIVASFEFYSARYCENNLIKPLHQVENLEELNQMVQPVFDQISLCCKRQVFFMNKYMENYKNGENISNKDKINKYLEEHFHPRTNPHFRDDDGIKSLVSESFRPQLHIVRAIYSHVSYLNEVKKMFSKDITKSRLCERLAEYIGFYLNLYKENFYNLLESTIGSYNNLVYDELKDMLKYQNNLYKNHFSRNIDISRRNKPFQKNIKTYKQQI